MFFPHVLQFSLPVCVSVGKWFIKRNSNKHAVYEPVFITSRIVNIQKVVLCEVTFYLTLSWLNSIQLTSKTQVQRLC